MHAFALLVSAAVTLASPGAAGSTPAPTPSSSPTAAATPLREIGHVTATGRKANLIGTATAASQGSISQEQIETRPVLRPGEVLEGIPGLVISQHSGEGKANQYYLRGFQLDHGTDLESTIAGIPINLPSHAHGQGYSDINWLMPELVGYVEFKKGPYYADQGDFSTAGAYDLFLRNTIDPTMEVGGGSFGYDRYFAAASPHVGQGTLLYGLELYHDNGSFVKPDEYFKYNGTLRYTRTHAATDYSVTGFAYNGNFDSSDQIPQRLVDAGVISRFGYIDPSDGGNTYRFALDAQSLHHDPNGTTKVNVYGVDSFLDLFSNFTYYEFDGSDYFNETANPVTCDLAFTSCNPYGPAHHTSDYSSYCPAYNTAPAEAAPHSVSPPAYTFACGDQREQVDKRFISGFDISRSIEPGRTSTLLGAGLRNDNIAENGLFLTNDRNRYPNGTLSDDHILERGLFAYAQSQIRIGGKLRLSPGLRLDAMTFDVGALDPNNSGRTTAALVSPKATAAYAADLHDEFYLDYGAGYHSNDARSILGVDDPQTHRDFDPSGAPVYQNTSLVRAYGEEAGYRYTNQRLTTTFSAYQLLLANELVFDGDHGTTAIGGPTLRRGVELANFWTPVPWLTYDADLATATARFIADPLHQGTGVPESLNAVIASGIAIDKPLYSAALRVRYFGPRQLDTAGNAYSPPTTTLNAQVTAKLKHGVRWSIDCFNLLNASSDDVTYYYGSWLPQDAANAAYANDPQIDPILGGRAPSVPGNYPGSFNGGGVNDYHFHPSAKRTVRITLKTRL